jgi:hypothetical protein
MYRSAIREPATAMALALADATTQMKTTALAARARPRRGIRVTVVRIMPVLYSLPIAVTAKMAMTAWPSMIPVRLSSVGSPVQPRAPHMALEVTPAPRATVRMMAPSSSHGVLASVRSFVHSAFSACLMRLACVAGRWPRPGQ